jgi:hypothetical protein
MKAESVDGNEDRELRDIAVSLRLSFFPFLLSCQGKMNGKQMDGNRRMTHSMLGRADGDLNRPDS